MVIHILDRNGAVSIVIKARPTYWTLNAGHLMSAHYPSLKTISVEEMSALYLHHDPVVISSLWWWWDTRLRRGQNCGSRYSEAHRSASARSRRCPRKRRLWTVQIYVRI